MRREGDEWYPSAAPPPRRRRVGAFLRRALTVVVCFALGVVLATGALIWQGRHELVGTRIAVDNLGQPPASEEETEPAGLRRVKTVLLVGDDSVDNIADENRDIATGERDGHRTDTIMVLRIDPDGKQVTGINFPRDLLVTLCDGSRRKINAAYFVGGADCLVDTIRDFAGLRIDHFVQVDFQGFVDIVNAVDGVTMYLEEPMEDPKAHLDLPKGCVTLDGRSALGFVRTRSDTDFGRIARQQRFLKELADEATSLDVVANPVRLFQTVDAVGDMMTVDDSMTMGTMRDFAMTLRGIDSDNITMATIPTATDNSTGQYFENPIEPTTTEVLQAFKRGELAEFLGEEDPGDEPSDGPSESRPEPEIALDELSPVSVLNASDVTGLAAETAAALADAGVQVGATGDADGPEPATVAIRYPQRLEDEATSLQLSAFPDAVLDTDSSVDGLTVVLNGNFDPDLMDVVGPGDEEDEDDEESTERPLPENEYTNADVVEEKDC
jgi:LCP family protein required for cell wall assembly